MKLFTQFLIFIFGMKYTANFILKILMKKVEKKVESEVLKKVFTFLAIHLIGITDLLLDDDKDNKNQLKHYAKENANNIIDFSCEVLDMQINKVQHPFWSELLQMNNKTTKEALKLLVDDNPNNKEQLLQLAKDKTTIYLDFILTQIAGDETSQELTELIKCVIKDFKGDE